MAALTRIKTSSTTSSLGNLGPQPESRRANDEQDCADVNAWWRNVNIRIDLDDKELRATLSRLVAFGHDLSPVTAEIAAHILRVTGDAFEQERDPATGSAWAPLSEVTLRQREKSGHVGSDGAKKLQASRNLLKSIVADFDAESAVVGTNLVYATTQQFGAERGEFGHGQFKTKKGSFPIPWGNIPARPFLGVSPEDERAITDIISDHVASTWAGNLP